MLFEREIRTSGKGLVDITAVIRDVLSESRLAEGLCTVFVRHTSSSLVIQENADPAVLRDLEAWFERAVPENDALYTHTDEGPDDMPSHVRVALTATSLSIPFSEGRLMLGTWQGVFLWEHRSSPKRRRVVIHVAP